MPKPGAEKSVSPAGHILLAFCALLIILVVYALVNVIHMPLAVHVEAAPTDAQNTS